ncbi:MAG TPA: isocitrate lyase/PEP mutase family protein [Desulfurococcaceae archaeon]|nr:isocitrate lyase/PEP mutase family protein [Desulfurococcaceae archaeon]
MKKTSTLLREYLKSGEPLLIPGVYDALSARIAEMLGFKVVIHTGYGTAASKFGLPDIGLVSFGEMVERVKEICRAISIPVIGDADTGYGNAVNVYRTVKEYIYAGAAGLFIEDQVWPKRCGHMFGKQIISMEEMIGKVMAAVDARNEVDPDFVIGARTDAIAVTGFEDAIERARAYVKAGADFIFIEAYENIDQMKEAVKELKGVPLMLNLIEGGRTPLVTFKEAADLGFKLIIFPLTALYSAAKAIHDNLKILKETGDPRNYLDKIMAFKDFAQVVNIKKFEELEKRYIPEKILKEKYRGEVRMV